MCLDDVSQAINDENGYCELQVKLDKDTNNTLRENMSVFNWIILLDSALERIVILIKLK
jgi:hypothetical protein